MCIPKDGNYVENNISFGSGMYDVHLNKMQFALTY